MNPINWLKSCIRGMMLRRKFPTSIIHSGATVDYSSELGEYSVLFRDVVIINSSLGAYSYVQSRSVVCNAEIGRFCSIASNVNVGLVDHPLQMLSTSPIFYDNTQPLPQFFINRRAFAEIMPPTIIGADVWIGNGVLIKAGVTIGVGAVIGAGSIVTKDVPPYVIAAGNPCRQIRPRFNEDIIQQLLDSKWWEFNEAKLKILAPTFVNVDVFLTELKNF